MKRTKSHKIASIIAIASILMVFMLSGILAYLKDQEQVTNVFTIGEVNIELIEKVSGTAGGTDEVLWSNVLTSVTGTDGSGNTVTVNALADIVPGQVIAKQPYVKNVGRNNAYVYLGVSVPKVSINGTDRDLFSYTVNNGWTSIGTTTETVDEITYNVYRYKYNEQVAVNGMTSTLFDSITVTDADWTPTELANMGNIQKVNINAYAIQADGLTVDQGANKFFNVNSVGDISNKDYGQYIEIGTNILDKTIQLEDGTTPAADWRVFDKDSNGAWLILADYMPNSAFDVTTVGLQTPENSVYEVYSPTSRVAFINSLNNSNWNNLIAGSDLAGVTGVSVKGTVSLETWADSWNGKGYTHLNIRAESMSDGLNGYYVYKDNQSNTTTFTDMSADATEYANTLYFPHHDVISACYTYWLATPAASENRLMAVKHTGNVLNGTYGSTDVGVRPVIYVPNSVGLDASGDVWTIAE